MLNFEKIKKQQPELNLEDANKILANVFKESEAVPNSVPLEVLKAYSNYRKERFSLQRMIIVIIMALFLMLPLLFVPAVFTIQADMAETGINPVYTLEVQSKMLVKRVTAQIGGHNIPVYEVDTHVYSIEPAINGKMKVTVTLLNNQQTTQYIDVGGADLETPVLISTETRDGLVYLYLSDIGSGVDYENVSAVGLESGEIQPEFIDEGAGCIAFPYPNSTMNVFIPDFAGNELQLVINIR